MIGIDEIEIYWQVRTTGDRICSERPAIIIRRSLSFWSDPFAAFKKSCKAPVKCNILLYNQDWL